MSYVNYKPNTKGAYIIMKETITIFTASKARELLKEGKFSLIDIKPDKTDPDRKRSVFIFKYENGIEDYL